MAELNEALDLANDESGVFDLPAGMWQCDSAG